MSSLSQVDADKMILITGFGSYHEDSNASGELVRSLMEGLAHRSGFIHISVLPKQVVSLPRNSAAMLLEMTRNALSLVINHVVEEHVRK